MPRMGTMVALGSCARRELGVVECGRSSTPPSWTFGCIGLEVTFRMHCVDWTDWPCTDSMSKSCVVLTVLLSDTVRPPIPCTPTSILKSKEVASGRVTKDRVDPGGLNGAPSLTQHLRSSIWTCVEGMNLNEVPSAVFHKPPIRCLTPRDSSRPPVACSVPASSPTAMCSTASASGEQNHAVSAPSIIAPPLSRGSRFTSVMRKSPR